MRILGIDPGLANLGFGVIEHDRPGASPVHVSHGVIETSKTMPLAQRLRRIHEGLVAAIVEFEPDQVAIEQIFFAKNVKTAISVAQARGVAILATAETDLPMYEYTPLQMKQAIVGYGRASKMQVQMMVRVLLRLDEIPRPDHAADALAAALCHLHFSQGLRALTRQMSAEPPTEDAENPAKILLAQSRQRRRRRRTLRTS